LKEEMLPIFDRDAHLYDDIIIIAIINAKWNLITDNIFAASFFADPRFRDHSFEEADMKDAEEYYKMVVIIISLFYYLDYNNNYYFYIFRLLEMLYGANFLLFSINFVPRFLLSIMRDGI
jgi:hypothetical protein